MTHATLHTHLNTSRLVRYLADLAPPDAAPPPAAFAQRLGQWVNFTDAMNLYSALNPGVPPPGTPSAQAPGSAWAAADAELHRVRAAMAELIQRACSAAPGAARIKFPIPAIETGPEVAVPWTPFHRFCLSVQREMDTKLGPLRATVRQALAQASPTLRQLGALDAALDTAMQEHERRLSGTVPKLMEKRFVQLRQEHQRQLSACGKTTDDSATWLLPGAWLARFRDELAGVLLAQWELRVQPVAALVQALGREVNGQT